MDTLQFVITFILLILATMITRFAAFVLFKNGKTPDIIMYLGKTLPAAIFALLVTYCLKDVSLLTGSHGLPEAISIAAIIAIHLYKRNTLLSIATGTIIYMLLVQLVF